MTSDRQRIEQVDLRDQIAARLGEAWPDLAEDPVYLDQLAAEAMAVVQPALDTKDAEIAFALKGTRDNTTYWQGRVGYWRSRSEQAEAERDRLYTAWWSARIGRAQARQEAEHAEAKQAEALKDAICANRQLNRALTALHLEGAERDQHAATIERVCALHRNQSGLCLECTSSHHAPWPCATIAALDQTQEPT